MTRSRRLGIAALVLLIVAISVAGVLFARRSPTTNVLIITLDTTRADRLGCYGHQQALTPAIDRLAAEGVLFTRAISPAPLTLPAHASMFTGLYPPEHGLRTNGRSRLAEEIPTLAATLREAQYDTGAFVASFVLDSRFGLSQGFDEYNEDLSGPDVADEALHRQRDGKSVVDAALKWLQSPRKKPFFCWVHLYDPHHPYLPHTDEFGDRFEEDPYDAEIAYVDRQVERLLSHLRTAGLEQSTVVVLAGDHGEGLGDHVERLHGYTLYGSTQHVPLVIREPRGLSPGAQVPAVVSLVDVAPTVLDAVGLRVPAGLSGRSLVSLLRGQSLPEKEAYSATDDPFLQNGWSPLRSLTTSRWKFIRTTKPELYDLAADPGELNNLAETQPDEVQRLSKALELFEQQMVPREAAAVQLSAQERRTLESLGYLRGAATVGEAAPASGDPLPDVKDMLPLDVLIQDALELMKRDELAKAEHRLRQVVEQSAVHVASRIYLGEALERQGKLDEAVRFYEQALALKGDSVDAIVHLGTARIAQGKLPEAIKLFDNALAVDPDSTAARFNLGLALHKQGSLSEAISQLEETLRLDPQMPNVHAALGQILIETGNRTAAIERLRQEIDLHPKTVQARVNLAVLLSETDPPGAEKLLLEAVGLSPDDPNVNYNLGAFYLLTQRPKLAIPHLEATLKARPSHPRAKEELSRARRLLNGASKP